MMVCGHCHTLAALLPGKTYCIARTYNEGKLDKHSQDGTAVSS